MTENSDFIQIQWTADNLDEAREITKDLIESGWIACASIIPLTESLYMWKDEIESTQEIKIVMKTRAEHYKRVEKHILKKHSYEVPEVLAVPIIAGSERYLDWLMKATK